MKHLFNAHTPNDDGNWHELKHHLSKVARRSQELASKFGGQDIAFYAGLWHDLGKYNPSFQDYLDKCHTEPDKKPRDKVPHAIYGAKLAAVKFQALAPLIYGHHGGLPQLSHMENRLAEVDAATYESILENARTEGIDLDLPSEIGDKFASLCRDEESLEFLLRSLFSCLVDADNLDTESHFQPETAKKRVGKATIAQLQATLEASQQQLLQAAKATPVNQVRSQVYQACLDAASLEPGVFRLAVPTGGGKTRSGLAFGLAHALKYNLDRVIVAVPYTSIIEQTVRVYREILGEDLVLEHHSAIQPDLGNEEDARSRWAVARLATQNWDAPLIVTTTVQLFESLFANRPSRCRKIHNITRSVIILDEVQTLPAKFLDPILSVLKQLCRQYRVTVVLCTATQPALEGETPYLKGFRDVKDIISPELAKQHFASLSRVEYSIPKSEWSWQEVSRDLEKHSQALAILNTRKDALAVINALEKTEDRVFHLSTLLCGEHRRQVLAKVRDRLSQNLPCLLISTQVVEAGVDLDFPVVYRALGPLDRIVQAAGRCNREGIRQDKGQVIIFEPKDGKLPPASEYRQAFDETRKILKGENLDWNDPAIFQTYFRRLYQGLNTDAEDIQKYRCSLDFPEVAKRFRLIADETTPVIIEYSDRATDLVTKIRRYGLKPGDMAKLQPYLVNLRIREFNQASELREEIAPGVWLWLGAYDRNLKGISIGSEAIVRDPADLIF